MYLLALVSLSSTLILLVSGNCIPSKTTASGYAAPQGQLCSGQLIFNDDFNQFNKSVWQHEITLAGGGNWEFQWYSDDINNSFVENGKLHIRPSLTVDVIGEYQLSHGRIKLDPCTNAEWFGCERQATPDAPINPIRSARLRTIDSFSFKYGRVEIVAKMPAGDWLWPAIWFLPTKSVYGVWPRSGEIDLLESRGNRNYTDDNNIQIGCEHFGSTLHFGPNWDQNAWQTATFAKNSLSGEGFNVGFHKYQVEWTDEHIKFSVDDTEVGIVHTGDGYWARGHFQGDNIWKNAGNDAPFNQEFHFILNLAVGGVNQYFPDKGNHNGAKPWLNSSPRAAADFWEGRNQWLSGWKLHENNGREASLIVDSIKVWAI